MGQRFRLGNHGDQKEPASVSQVRNSDPLTALIRGEGVKGFRNSHAKGTKESGGVREEERTA